MTAALAESIVNGSWCPWKFQSDIASPADWLFAAQCALDGDDSDLRIYLDRMDASRSAMVLPDNEDWKHGRAVAGAVVRRVRKAA